MTCFFPYGVVDRWLTIYPKKHASSPDSGMVSFPNGFTRKMKTGELAYYWEDTGAKHAWELYRKQRVSPDTGSGVYGL